MWESLSEEQKVKYKTYCDEKYGKSKCSSENGEPLYINDNCYLVNTDMLIKLLFSVHNN